MKTKMKIQAILEGLVVVMVMFMVMVIWRSVQCPDPFFKCRYFYSGVAARVLHLVRAKLAVGCDYYAVMRLAPPTCLRVGRCRLLDHAVRCREPHR
jgi:hypothetical protein